MHQLVLDFVSSQFQKWRLQNQQSNLQILEFGSLDINGSVRSVLQQYCDKYVGVDMQGGPGVDVIDDAATFVARFAFDVVVCAEVFEHTPHWRHIIANAHKSLRDGGLFIATMAGEGRAPHSAIDEKPIRSWEYYDNVGWWELNRTMSMFARHEIDTVNFDIRCWGIK